MNLSGRSGSAATVDFPALRWDQGVRYSGLEEQLTAARVWRGVAWYPVSQSEDGYGDRPLLRAG